MVGKDFSLAIRIGDERHGIFLGLCLGFFSPVLKAGNKNTLILLSSDTYPIWDVFS